MRVLAVITRQVAKTLISPADIEMPPWWHEDDELPPPPPDDRDQNILEYLLRSDDITALKTLIRCRAILGTIAHQNEIEYGFYYWLAKCNLSRILLDQIKRGIKLDDNVSVTAVKYERTDILYCLETNDQPINENLCAHAAANNNPEMIKWLREHGYSWGEDVVISAAQSNAVAALEYLWQNGCPWPWDGSAVVQALKKHIGYTTVKWQMENDCPMPNDLCELINACPLLKRKKGADLCKEAMERGYCTCNEGYHFKFDEPAPIQKEFSEIKWVDYFEEVGYTRQQAEEFAKYAAESNHSDEDNTHDMAKSIVYDYCTGLMDHMDIDWI